jgi:hypothetical protein
MYLLARLHPDVVRLEGDSFKEGWLNRFEKEQQISRFYRENLRIPLNIDHRGADATGFIAGSEKESNTNMGHVVDMFNDRNGDLMIKCLLRSDHPAYRQINQSMCHEQAKWGVSVWLTHQHPKGFMRGPILKNIAHVALTTDPALAAQDTFLLKWALNEDYMDAEIRRSYYAENDWRCFFDGPLKKKMTTGISLLLPPL